MFSGDEYYSDDITSGPADSTEPWYWDVADSDEVEDES